MEAAGKRYIIYRSKSDIITLHNITDIHWLSKGCAEKRVRADVKAIAEDPYSFWVGGGDYCDYIGYHDQKRFDPDAVADWIPISKLGQLGAYGREQIKKLFWPIRHKCLGLLFGNHERKYEVLQEQQDGHAWLCTELGVPNLGYSCLMDLVFVRQHKRRTIQLVSANEVSESGDHDAFRLFLHHGAGFAQTKGGKLNRLKQFMDSFVADVFMVGHVHDKTGTDVTMIGGDRACKELMDVVKVGVISGGYLRTYAPGVTTYGEQRGYAPTTLGTAWVQFRPFKHQILGRS